jgi:hypothetical protein
LDDANGDNFVRAHALGKRAGRKKQRRGNQDVRKPSHFPKILAWVLKQEAAVVIANEPKISV